MRTRNPKVSVTLFLDEWIMIQRALNSYTPNMENGIAAAAMEKGDIEELKACLMDKLTDKQQVRQAYP